MRRVDLNCDMGELPEMLANGRQEALMRSVTSVNVACGGHAGDEALMRQTIEQALRHGVAIGAHPGYEDRENFGRTALSLTPGEIRDSVYRQVTKLAAIARKCGAQVGHVKAHGALYNQAASDTGIARAIAEGVRRWRQDVVLVGLAGSLMLDEFRAAGFRAAAGPLPTAGMRRTERCGHGSFLTRCCITRKKPPSRHCESPMGEAC